MEHFMLKLKQKNMAKPKPDIKIKLYNPNQPDEEKVGEPEELDELEEVLDLQPIEEKQIKTNQRIVKIADRRKDFHINRDIILNRLKNKNIIIDQHIINTKQNDIVIPDNICIDVPSEICNVNKPVYNPPDITDINVIDDNIILPEITEKEVDKLSEGDVVIIKKKKPIKPKATEEGEVVIIKKKKTTKPIEVQEKEPKKKIKIIEAKEEAKEETKEEAKEEEKEETKTPKKRGRQKKTRKQDLEEIPIDQIEIDKNIIIENKSLGQRLQSKEQQIVKTSKYYMNNRKLYIEKIAEIFRPFKKEIEEKTDDVSCSSSKKNDISLFTHQKIVKEYLNIFTPYRGLLLYHGLGSGKTCTSIAIAEGMKTFRQIILLTPASLKMNYFSELKKCGDYIYKKNQHWDFISTKDKPEYVNILAKVLQISPTHIRSNQGAWLVDITKKRSNYTDLSTTDQENLDDQLNLMIRSKYIDINYNSSRIKEDFAELSDGFTKNPFDNKTIIIDEAHNFVSRIVNKLKKPTSISYILYDYLMNATNAKIVLLTGTPIINYPNELGVLFNILRGYIKTWHFQLNLKNTAPAGFKINREEIIKILYNNNFNTFDYVEYSGNILTITRNPFGFINVVKKPTKKTAKKGGKITFKRKVKKEKNKTRKLGKMKIVENENETIEQPIRNLNDEPTLYDINMDYYNRINVDPHKEGGTILNNNYDEIYNGVTLDETGNINDIQFVNNIKNILSKNHIEIVNVKNDKNKSLPDDKDAFIEIFLNTDTNEVKNLNVFKKRILGLTSYFRSADEKLLPSFVKTDDDKEYHIVPVELSEYQFAYYEKIRKEEAEKEKNIRKVKQMEQNKKGEIFNISSSYRVFSREACNFAFPDPPGKPMLQHKKDNLDGDDGNDEMINEYEEEEEDLDEPSNQKKKNKKLYNQQVQNVLDMIKHNPEKPIDEQYLILENLEKYSPKFKKIIENIQNNENKGLHLLYSQFRSIEGIGILKLALEANGFTEFKIIKSETNNNDWIVDENSLNGKPKFVLYTGTETQEEKEIIRNIYNSNWDMVPASITSKLRDIHPNNYYGEIIKILMITASGSEGINLKNTRFVHIVEPYWNMVRIEQVIGRARRICSHQDLPDEFRTVKVFLYLSVFSKEQKTNKRNIELMNRDVSRVDNKPITTDENLFEIATLKTRINNQLLKSVKETSIDCSLYYSKKNKENLVCYNFGKISSNSFATLPELEQDIGMGETENINVRKEKIKLKLIKIDGKEYAFDKETNLIYSYDSYLQLKEGVGQLERVGKVVKEGTKYKVVLE
jgi:hypothetical protein